ncbi:hypothetical protein Gotri_025293 [Gossypium trilobum]|uniref:Uncharacterized protein n=1 Tax=Gossypium trilobum TaxID=34281 RepID=A0A7J9FN40_9ROSI|nr:hypothetical protein [Gossypium trilobum]
MNITGMSEQWITARIKQKDGKKKVDVFALSIYGLVSFPRALGYVDEAVSDLFDHSIKGSRLFLQYWLRRFHIKFSPKRIPR